MDDTVLVSLIAVSVGTGSKDRLAAAAILLSVLTGRDAGKTPLADNMECMEAEATADVAREIRMLIAEYKLH